ncbi:ABC transporter permease DevC [Rivularia sp. UHCC 0363]|uniref:ABC transporter permease DevC n=1 Tax=Rivularia sp. UHCC 0363 TaxID=3110244 RepID=UPI002B1F890E|nr:ABC transporter permease DevC [Rivularia sp. UHCC 0363]MEA5599385.1 ABC transporter permease DevC [Rivularia sp. UHCC 0363]
MIGFIQQLQRRTPLGWLQLSRQKGRLLVALSGVAFADLLMLMQLGFQNALFSSATRLHDTLRADLVLLSPQALNLQDLSTFTRRRLYQAMDVPGVATAEPMYNSLVTWRNPQTRLKTQVMIIGFNPDKPAFDLPEVDKHIDAIKLPDTILFDEATRGTYEKVIAQIKQGQTVTTEIQGRTITIADVFKVGASFAADGTLMTSDQNFLRLFPRQDSGSANLGLIRLKPGYEPEQVAAELKYHLRDAADVKVFTKQEFIDFEKAYWQTNTPIGFIFSLGTAMGFIVGVIIVYQVLSTDVNAHMKEYATFKAMGYRNFFLLTVVFEEAIILAVLGFIPGAAISTGLYALTRNATNLPLYMTVARVVQVQVMTIIMCMISGAVATRKVQSADPADMF